jgi:protein gp37
MKRTAIQWCHSTVNPVMGCHGCELWKPAAAIVPELAAFVSSLSQGGPAIRSAVARAVGNRTTSDLYRDREAVAAALALIPGIDPFVKEGVIDVIRRYCKCYAGMLGTMRAGHKGYADTFENPKLFPGRMAEAASWGAPTEAESVDKPWLGEMPRLIFISDMGDALSANVPFEYLDHEIIGNVTSTAGQRHIWLWLSKRPDRMAEFGAWLLERGGYWPINLVAMTTVTSHRFIGRVDHLRRVPAPFKALSLEPLSGPVQLNLKRINWVIVGGGSDVLADMFFVEWALDLKEQCNHHGVAFFLKQLGRAPFARGKVLELKDPHGGDWNEWSDTWRVRQMPNEFWEWGARSAID